MGTCLKCPKNGQNKHVPKCPNRREKGRCMREGGGGGRRGLDFFRGMVWDGYASDEFAGEKENLGKGTFRERSALFCFASRRRPDPYHSGLTYRRARGRKERLSRSYILRALLFGALFKRDLALAKKNGGKFKSEVLCLAFEMFITRFLRICHLMTRTLITPSIPFRASESITLSVSMRV